MNMGTHFRNSMLTTSIGPSGVQEGYPKTESTNSYPRSRGMGDPFDNLARYTYEPLTSPQSFRLLHFASGHCYLASIHLTISEYQRNDISCPTYTALSYTWGDINSTIPITLNGQLAYVTSNLNEALLHLRKIRPNVALWIDALSVNQSDSAERGHQVNQMRAIYSSAANVVSWLGPGFGDTDRLFTFIWNHHHGCCTKPSSERSTCGYLADPGLADALQSLESRPYWNRIWIIQEVVVATELEVMCGDESIPWSIFAAFWPLIFEDHFKKVPGMQRKLAPPDFASAVLPLTKWRRENVGLSYAIQHTGLSKATDGRDKVYALLGLVDKGAGRHLPVDYTISACAVYLVATQTLIRDWIDDEHATRTERLEGMLDKISDAPRYRGDCAAKWTLLECRSANKLRQYLEFMLGLSDHLDMELSTDEGQWTASCNGEACGSWAAMWDAATIDARYIKKRLDQHSIIQV